jgi:hypothetical protein
VKSLKRALTSFFDWINTLVLTLIFFVKCLFFNTFHALSLRGISEKHSLAFNSYGHFALHR